MQGISVTLAGSTSADQDVTIPGFGTPKAAIFFTSELAFAGQNGNVVSYSVGAYDGTNERSGGMSVVEAPGATAAHYKRADRNDTVSVLPNRNGAVSGTVFTLDAVTFIEDGVRINANLTATPYTIGIVLIGGEAIESAVVGNFSTAAAATVSPGNRMDLGFFFGANPIGGYNATPDTNVASIYQGWAAHNGSTYDQYGSKFLYTNSRDARAVVRNDAAVAINDTQYISIDTQTATTFDITPSGASQPGSMNYLSLQLAEGYRGVWVADAPPNATGVKRFDHGIAGGDFIAAFQLKGDYEAYGTHYLDGRGMGYGIQMVFRENDDANPGDIGTIISAEDTVANVEQTNDRNNPGALKNDAGTVLYAAGAATKDGDGFSLNFTTANATSHLWPTLHIIRG